MIVNFVLRPLSAIVLSKQNLNEYRSSLTSSFRLDYKDWGICLPRGPVGQADSANGTYDHVLLLYGRLVQCKYRKPRGNLL